VLDCANGDQKETHEEGEENCAQESDTNEGEEAFQEVDEEEACAEGSREKPSCGQETASEENQEGG
jgi:hypothetical protein